MVHHMNVDIDGCKLVSCDPRAREVRSCATVRAGRFRRFNLTDISHVMGHFSWVNGTMATSSRRNCSPALNASELSLDNHRIFGFNVSNLIPRYIDARERILNSDTQICEMEFRTLQEKVNTKKRGAANDENSNRVIIGVRKAGEGKKTYKCVAEKSTVQRSFGTKNLNISAGLYQITKFKVYHE